VIWSRNGGDPFTDFDFLVNQISARIRCDNQDMPLLIVPRDGSFCRGGSGSALAHRSRHTGLLLSDTHIFRDKTGEYRGFRPYDI